ncbi:DNA modification methylase [Rathayibacter rathayi]|uniref:site-specific DNA-methyltransferase (cytosine-N(4)-specific) n=2 Tax=Rathayibacter rathayi TaxID=33887 RepID=A0ABD6W7S5_RATRA|nr:DNA modification methylase [Rathayibacter rathayi]PPI01853.1 DNA modification methylase [Rathayibacter rathayi]
MKLPVHRWFRYSAGFSGDWAESVIESTGARRVLDPFAGSGTTVVAAERQGVSSIGVDVHPFVARVAQAKLHWRADPNTLLRRMKEVVHEVSRDLPISMPTAPLLAKCFPDPTVLRTLLQIKNAIEATRRNDEYDELLWLALVSIIRVCSPVGTAQWQYVLPNKTKARVAEPHGAFAARVELFAEDMVQMQRFAGYETGLILETDARKLNGVPDGWADLILTSPPYANNFDYADATRLEQTFLGEIEGWADLKPLRRSLLKSATQHMPGWDPAEAFDSPLLAPIRGELLDVYAKLNSIRTEKVGNKAYHLMVLGYFFDSAQIWQSLRRASSPGVQVCYVVGDSAPYGIHVPVERWLAELALSAGFNTWSFDKVRDRNTKWKNRKHTHPLHEGRLWIEG